MPAKTKSTASAQFTATIGFEAKLWLTADKLRNNMDAAEPSGANRVERDSLLKAARRVHAGACGKQTATGSPQGERGGVHQFYTPSCVVRCLVEPVPVRKDLAPYKGRIYDPACGSGGSLPASRLCSVRFAKKDRAIAQGVVQSENFVESHGGKLGDISIHGKESNATAWRLTKISFGLKRLRPQHL